MNRQDPLQQQQQFSLDGNAAIVGNQASHLTTAPSSSVASSSNLVVTPTAGMSPSLSLLNFGVGAMGMIGGKHPIDAVSDLNLAAVSASIDPNDWSSYLSFSPSIPTTASTTSASSPAPLTVIPSQHIAGAIPPPPPSLLALATNASSQLATGKSGTSEYGEKNGSVPQQTNRPPMPLRTSSSGVSINQISRPPSTRPGGSSAAATNMKRQNSGLSLRRVDSNNGGGIGSTAHTILERERGEAEERSAGARETVHPTMLSMEQQQQQQQQRMMGLAGGVTLKERSERGASVSSGGSRPTPKLSIPGPYTPRSVRSAGIHSPTMMQPGHHHHHQHHLTGRPYPAPHPAGLPPPPPPPSAVSTTPASRLGNVGGLRAGGVHVHLPPSLWMSPSNPTAGMVSSPSTVTSGTMTPPSTATTITSPVMGHFTPISLHATMNASSNAGYGMQPPPSPGFAMHVPSSPSLQHPPPSPFLQYRHQQQQHQQQFQQGGAESGTEGSNEFGSALSSSYSSHNPLAYAQSVAS
ncbi:hypothetical protein FRC16_006889, partial [Serendipita sp. 398]